MIKSPADIANAIRSDLQNAVSKTKRLKLRTLLAKFGFSKRSDANTGMITQHLNEAGVSLNPPITRLGLDWELHPEDWVYLSSSTDVEPLQEEEKAIAFEVDYNADGWFDRLANMELRTEKEVEIKFIVPLLSRLGYTDDDRYDGMPVPAAHGSRDTTLVIDFALFNSGIELLNHQPLLTVEAKRENRLVKKQELFSAHNQAKSYCLWTQCDFFMVTDSKTIQAFHISRGRLNELDPLFACERHELKDRFPDLHDLVSKEALTRHYVKKLGNVEQLV